MQSKAKTVREYLAELPKERREAIEVVRSTILKHLPKGYEEIMQYGMIAYVVPLTRYPAGYLDNKEMPLPYIALASQKNYMALYLTNIYTNEESRAWFTQEYKASGKKLDMGKSCVRFKTLDDVPLGLVGKAVALTSVKEMIALYEEGRLKRK